MKAKSNIGSDVMLDLKRRLRSRSFKKEYEQAKLQIAVGKEARKIAQDKKLSVRVLAEKMQASPSQVVRLFGDKNVSLDTLAKFAAATGKVVSVHFK